MAYDYWDNIKADVESYIDENGIVVDDNLDKDQLLDELYLSVTGEADGSYFCSSWKAEEALNHNRDVLNQAVSEYCYEGDALTEALTNPETGDIIVRDYLLPSVLQEVLDERRVEEE